MIFRKVLSALVAVALLLVPAPKAGAILFSGSSGTPAPDPELLTTLTIQNTSGSTQATNFVTQIFGHPFKQGDIANGCSGGAPKFELTNGTNVPFSESSVPICWSDGSLKWAAFMLRVPTTIAGSGSLTINILSGGTTPSASGRGAADASTGGTDLNVSVTGLATIGNLSGDWVSNLNQGISAAHSDDYTYMDGDAGWVGRVRASFRQSAADHGQLEGYWYLVATETGSGLGGIRYLHQMTQPWYNIDSPAKNFRAFSAYLLKDGSSTIRDMFTGHFGASMAKNFTWTSGSTLDSASIGFDTSVLVHLTNSGGSLPTGLSSSTAYFAAVDSSSTFRVGTNSAPDGIVTPSGAGSGTHTATPYPFLPHFSSLYSAGTTGKYDYIQAGGSVAADSTTRIAVNNIYWRSTKLIGPYDFENISPDNSSTAVDYYPLTAAGMLRAINTGGERPEIGPFTDWAVRHMYNQNVTDEQRVRVISLAGAALPIFMRNKTTFTIPVVNNGPAKNGVTYSGMPAVNITFNWQGSNAGFTSGFTNPTDTNVLTMAFNATDYSHLPEFSYYAALFTGEPHNKDLLTSWGSMATVNHAGPTSKAAVVDGTTNSLGGISPATGPSTRNLNVNGTLYYGASNGYGNGMRVMAWINRDMGYACALAGGSEPANDSVADYTCDNNNSIYAANNNYTTMLPSAVSDAGMYLETSSGPKGAMWQTNYYQQIVGLVAGMTEDSEALTHTTYLARFNKWLYDNLGVWMMTSYYHLMRDGNDNTPSGNDTFHPYITSPLNYCAVGSYAVDWTNGNPVFTLSATAAGYLPANDDRVIWMSGDGLISAPPVNFSELDPYYMVSAGVGGATKFQLSATSGGSAVTPGDSQTNKLLCLASINHPATNNFYGTTLIITQSAGSLNIAKAVGATYDTTTLNAVNTNAQATSGYSTDIVGDNLKYSFGQSY